MFRIHSLHVGTVVLDHPEPLFIWYIEGEQFKVLVDLGMPEAAEALRRSRTKAEGGGPQHVAQALAGCGISPSDVDHVILTHLHFDHAWNLDLFPNAQVIVQRDEIVHAIKPEPVQRGFYSRELNAKLVGRRQPQELLILEGDYTLAPGLTIVHSPGHTPGTQAVLVETEKGVVALCSDVGDTYGNWFPADPRASSEPAPFLSDSFRPPDLRTESVRVCCASMARLRDLAAIIVPSHDWRIPRHMPDQWWEIPPQTRDPE